MPTYSYRCAECDHAFDIHQAFTDDNLTICPNCGGKLRKVFSPVGVSFSGSGFYRTDSRAEAGKSSGSKDARSSGDGGSGGATSGSESSGAGSSGSGAGSSGSAAGSKGESKSATGAGSGSSGSGSSSSGSGSSSSGS